MPRLWSVSDEYLLQGFQEAFVLNARPDRDPEPAGDRFTIVMADEDPSLAQSVRDGRRRVARRGFHEHEVRLRGRVLKTKLVQLVLQPDALRHHVIDDLAVVLHVLD